MRATLVGPAGRRRLVVTDGDGRVLHDDHCNGYRGILPVAAAVLVCESCYPHPHVYVITSKDRRVVEQDVRRYGRCWDRSAVVEIEVAA